jgi:hypothetical protein
VSIKKAIVLTQQEIEEFHDSLLKKTQAESAYRAAESSHRTFLGVIQNKYDFEKVRYDSEMKTIHITDDGIAIFGRER